VSCKVEHTKAHLTKLKGNTKVNKLQSEQNIKIMEITEEQIKEAHNAACSQWKQKIEQWFPECFKQKLEVGKWYKSKTGSIVNYQGGTNGYGLTYFGDWCNNSNWDTFISESLLWTPATTEEVESMLIKEAEKKGFIDNNGVNFIGVEENCYGKNNHILNTKILVDSDIDGGVYASKGWIMKDGKWATIVETPKEMTLEEIEKKLGHKVKIVS